MGTLIFAHVSFLYPLFTVAALSIAIPVIIHLFNFRRYKKVFFPDIRFLQQLQEQTRKQSQLKHWLILVSRILALLALVLAFAQPLRKQDKTLASGSPKARSIYIDNSFSMGLETHALSLLDQAKAKAKNLIEHAFPGDRIQLLTNDFSFNENRFLSPEEALQQLGDIRVSAKNRQAAVILEKQKQLLKTEPGLQPEIVFISDFYFHSFYLNFI